MTNNISDKEENLEIIKEGWNYTLEKEQNYCKHTTCHQCKGTGRRKIDGKVCLHYLVCTCNRCSITY